MTTPEGLFSTLRSARRRVLDRQNGPGAWIFDQLKLSWLHSISGDELPLHLRAFGAYCGAQQRLGVSGRVVAGPLVFEALGRLGEALGIDAHMRLDWGDHVIDPNTRDPRSLHVPNELSPGSPIRALLARWLRRGDTFLDVGANHGSFSVLASSLVGPEGLVAAVEPQAELASLIERSLLEVKGLRFIVKALALGERTGTVPFFVPRNSSGSAGIFPSFSARGSHRVRQVELAVFDDALPWESFPGRPFMKLDVEGSELSVLRGARRFLRARKPAILMETNHETLDAARVALTDLRDELGEAGYTHVAPFPGTGWQPLETMTSLRSADLLVASGRDTQE